MKRPEPKMMNGWFADQYAKGIEPDLSEPLDPYVEPVVESMEVVIGFFMKSDRLKNIKDIKSALCSLDKDVYGGS